MAVCGDQRIETWLGTSGGAELNGIEVVGGTDTGGLVVVVTTCRVLGGTYLGRVVVVIGALKVVVGITKGDTTGLVALVVVVIGAVL